jgi:hypothetical protein
MHLVSVAPLKNGRRFRPPWSVDDEPAVKREAEEDWGR